MSSFGGRNVDHEDSEAQVKSLGELLRLQLEGIDPATLNLVILSDNDYVIDTTGNLIKWG